MRILFIACYSPFINNSAAIETLQYLNNLCKIEGNEITLLTVDFPKNSIYYDEALSKMIDKRIKVHLISGGNLFNKLVPKKVLTSGKETGIYKNVKIKVFLRKIKNSIAIPDMYYNWAKRAAKKGKELMKENRYDVIFSMHEPPSSHLCAYYIKKEFKEVPWITYWSDPWLKDSTREKSFLLKRKIEGTMEKNIVSLANKFIFVTEDNLKDYEETYNIPKDKSFIITRGYEKGLYEKLMKEEKPSLIEEDKINIIYAGEIFSKLRNIRPFIGALKKIKEENLELYNKFNIMFFGNIDDVEGKNELSKLEVVKISNRIPFNEALKYMLNSQVLLIFGNKNSKQIPAKIYDYFGAKGRIFVIYGDEKDPIRKLVENHEKCFVTLNNEEDIKNSFLNMINKSLEEGFFGEEDLNYEWSSVAKKLNKILRSN